MTEFSLEMFARFEKQVKTFSTGLRVSGFSVFEPEQFSGPLNTW